MTTLTISLTEDRLQQLRERAAQLRVAPEELVRASIEELLTRPCVEDDCYTGAAPCSGSEEGPIGRNNWVADDAVSSTAQHRFSGSKTA
jgi:hypothetical protein